MNESFDRLLRKVKTLNETVWEDRAPFGAINDWLENFDKAERTEALFVLSQFVYYGTREMRELLRALFRELVRDPAYANIRETEGTSDVEVVRAKFRERLERTRFLGVGNPSESGTHLLYFFRQENRLPKEAFIHAYELFGRDPATGARSIRDRQVLEYVFIDDLCGSGDQAQHYSRELVSELKQHQPSARVGYVVLFATDEGINQVRTTTQFDYAEALCVFDASDRCMSPESRVLASCPDDVDPHAARRMALEAGRRVWPPHPLGYRDGQLLVGFAHNTPDNSLPIIWGGPDPARLGWRPIFPRYHKIYDWSHYGG